MPRTQQVSSTNTTISYFAQFATDAPTTPTTPLDVQVESGLHLLVHESLLNAFVGRSGLKGMKTTDRELKALLAPYEYKSTNDELAQAEPPVGVPGMDSIVTDIEFDDDDPLTIRVEKNSTLVTLREIQTGGSGPAARYGNDHSLHGESDRRQNRRIAR